MLKLLNNNAFECSIHGIKTSKQKCWLISSEMQTSSYFRVEASNCVYRVVYSGVWRILKHFLYEYDPKINTLLHFIIN